MRRKIKSIVFVIFLLSLSGCTMTKNHHSSLMANNIIIKCSDENDTALFSQVLEFTDQHLEDAQQLSVKLGLLNENNLCEFTNH